MASRTEDQLSEYGCDLTNDQFRDLLLEQKAITSPNWSIDKLLCNPDEAKAFCNHIRTFPGCAKLPDELILRPLLNARKNPNT